MYTLSIETKPGESYQHGYHLGTDLDLAKSIAVDRYHGRVREGMPTVTVAIMKDGKLVDCYYGDKWHSET